MAPAKPIYDLTLLLDADAPSERRAEILAGVEQAIGNGGEIVGKHDWGVRTLAYEIEHHKESEYYLIQLTAPPELLERLRNTLRVTDGVLRHRIIRLPANMQPPPVLRPEPRTESPPAEAAPAEAPAPAAESAPAPEAPAAEAPAAEAPAAEAPAAEAPAAEAPAPAPAAEAPAEAATAEAAPAEEPAAE